MISRLKAGGQSKYWMKDKVKGTLRDILRRNTMITNTLVCAIKQPVDHWRNQRGNQKILQGKLKQKTW